MRHSTTKSQLINAMKRPPKTAAPTLDPMQEAFLRSLGSKGIIDLPDEPEQDEGERRRQAMQDLAEWNRYLASGEYDADREAREEAEAEAERYQSLSVAEQLAEACRSGSSRSTVPLNGAGVLMAAIRGLGAKNVTSNGQSASGTL
jgi:hypothetical protein